jgi:hypothetical protein
MPCKAMLSRQVLDIPFLFVEALAREFSLLVDIIKRGVNKIEHEVIRPNQKCRLKKWMSS